MSCRTFKRHLEFAMFDELVEICKEKGITKINGAYYPTAKNLIVNDFYNKIGFELVSEDDKNNKTFLFEDFDNYKNLNEVIKVNLP